MLLRGTVYSRIQNDLIIKVNPSNINYYIGANITRFQGDAPFFLKKVPKIWKFKNKVLTRFSPFKVYTFEICSRDYITPKLLEENQKFQKVKDLIRNREQFKNSYWYNYLNDQIELNGFAQHKAIIINSKKELTEFFHDYVLDLVETMEKDGYVSKKADDLPNIMIGKNGGIHKSNAGDHRFFVAKLVGVKSMPFRVKGVHEAWLKKHSIPNKKESIEKIAKAIKILEKEYQ